MIGRNERTVVEALKKSDAIAIEFNGVRVQVRNQEFSHDVAIALQTHFIRADRELQKRQRNEKKTMDQ